MLYNTISFATFAACAGNRIDGGRTVTNGGNGFVLAALMLLTTLPICGGAIVCLLTEVKFAAALPCCWEYAHVYNGSVGSKSCRQVC